MGEILCICNLIGCCMKDKYPTSERNYAQNKEHHDRVEIEKHHQEYNAANPASSSI